MHTFLQEKNPPICRSTLEATTHSTINHDLRITPLPDVGCAKGRKTPKTSNTPAQRPSTHRTMSKHPPPITLPLSLSPQIRRARICIRYVQHPLPSVPVSPRKASINDMGPCVVTQTRKMGTWRRLDAPVRGQGVPKARVRHSNPPMETGRSECCSCSCARALSIAQHVCSRSRESRSAVRFRGNMGALGCLPFLLLAKGKSETAGWGGMELRGVGQVP